MVLPGRHGQSSFSVQVLLKLLRSVSAGQVLRCSAQLKDTSVAHGEDEQGPKVSCCLHRGCSFSSTPGTRIPWSLPPLPDPAPSASQLRGPQGWGTHPPV